MSFYLLLFKNKKCMLICSNDSDIINEFEYFRNQYMIDADISNKIIFNIHIYKTFDKFKAFAQDYCYMELTDEKINNIITSFSNNREILDEFITVFNIDRTKIPKTLA